MVALDTDLLDNKLGIFDSQDHTGARHKNIIKDQTTTIKYLTQGFDISALDTDSHSFCKEVPAFQEGKDELQQTYRPLLTDMYPDSPRPLLPASVS